jgi:hypothetical protein
MMTFKSVEIAFSNKYNADQLRIFLVSAWHRLDGCLGQEAFSWSVSWIFWEPLQVNYRQINLHPATTSFCI